MLIVEVEGAKHPKTITVITDDQEGELGTLIERCEEWMMEESDFCQRLKGVELLNHEYRIPLIHSEVGDISELLYSCDYINAADSLDRVVEDYLNAQQDAFDAEHSGERVEGE